jgi:hypothetical protein
MTIRKCVGRASAAAAVMGILSAAAVAEVSTKVQNACTPDARRLCPEHSLGSEEMRYCMEAKFKNISKDCVLALEDDGLVARGTYADNSARRR